MYVGRVSIRFLLIFVLGFSVLPLLSPADEQPPVDHSSLFARAELILHGQVEAKTVQRDDRGRIFTEVEVRVIELWKGKHPGKTLLLVHPGGVLGDIETKASGQPEYKPGEEVVLFCVENDAGKYVTVGLGNGKFRVENGIALNPNTNPARIPLAKLKAQVK